MRSPVDAGTRPLSWCAASPSKLALTDLLYFSFSTLTTIGFGDIVPRHPRGQVAAILEGIIGTLFLAILIAKLVGVYPPPAHDTHSEGEPRMKPSGDITRSCSWCWSSRMLLAGSFWTLLPFLGGLIWAATVVIATWPLLLRVRARTGKRRGWPRYS